MAMASSKSIRFSLTLAQIGVPQLSLKQAIHAIYSGSDVCVWLLT